MRTRRCLCASPRTMQRCWQRSMPTWSGKRWRLQPEGVSLLQHECMPHGLLLVTI